MRSADPGRYAKVEKIVEAIYDGEEFDPKTGRENKLREEDEDVEREPEDHIWIYLGDALTAAIPTDGSLPVPTEAREIFEHGLGDSRILHPENQAFALQHLRNYFAGRAEGLAVKFEKPKGKGDKSTRRRGGARSPRRNNKRR